MSYYLHSFISLITILVTATTSKLPKEFEAKVIGVKDGDTIEVLYKNEPIIIRLGHIDCPEKREVYWKKAKQFTADFCFGKQVKVISNGRFDRYRRLIAEIQLENKILNKELVIHGYARHFKKYSKDIHYAAIEKEAKNNNVGIWSIQPIDVTIRDQEKKPKKKNESDEIVFICYSLNSETYHYTKDCRGLSRCTDTIIPISKLKASNQYGRVLCSYGKRNKSN